MENRMSNYSKEKIENFKTFLMDEIRNLLALVEYYKEVYKKMSEEVSSDQGDVLKEDNKRVNTRSSSNSKPIPENYPKNGTLPPKVKYIINEFGRGTTEQEIREKIEEYEGDRARKTLNKFKGLFYNLWRREAILKFHYKTSAVIMYGLLDWKDELTQSVKSEFHPSVEMIDDIPEDQVIPENLIIEK